MIDCLDLDLSDPARLAHVVALAKRHDPPLPLLLTVAQRKVLEAGAVAVDGALYIAVDVQVLAEGEQLRPREKAPPKVEPPPEPDPVEAAVDVVLADDRVRRVIREILAEQAAGGRAGEGVIVVATYNDPSVTYDDAVVTYDGEGGDVEEGPPVAHMVGRRVATSLSGRLPSTALIGRQAADVQFPSMLVAR